MTGFAFAKTEDDVTSYYRWFAMVRAGSVAAAALALGGMRLFGSLSFDPLPVLYFLMPALLASSLLWNALLQARLWPRFFLYLQIVVDTAIVTAGIYFTGGAHSDFLFVLLVMVISSALIGTHAMVFVTLLCTAATGLLVYLAPTPHLHADYGRVVLFVFVSLVIGLQSRYFMASGKEKDEAMLKLKDEFLFRAVHDLRAPLAAIRWITESFKKPQFLALHPDMAPDIKQVTELSGRMARLIEDLLAVSRGEQATVRMKLEPVNSTGVIRQLTTEFAPRAEAQNVILSLRPESAVLNVIADKDLLREVLSNLLENALKYNRPGGSVTLSTKTVGSNVVIEVQDTGIGIPEKNMASLFTPYFRAPEVKNIPGTGLGLYLVKQLVEKMNGRVSVTSTPSQGSTFTVALPISLQ